MIELYNAFPVHKLPKNQQQWLWVSSARHLIIVLYEILKNVLNYFINVLNYVFLILQSVFIKRKKSLVTCLGSSYLYILSLASPLKNSVFILLYSKIQYPYFKIHQMILGIKNVTIKI